MSEHIAFSLIFLLLLGLFGIKAELWWFVELGME